VFALSSDEEGLGIVILEAMACAIPVVATKCGGPDGIITDGKDGYLIPLGQAETMANKLIKLLLDFELNKRVGASARQTIVERFEENVAGNVFVDMWDKLVS
jgi:glycosyltransferase involved in cell wall biosynthesis